MLSDKAKAVAQLQQMGYKATLKDGIVYIFDLPDGTTSSKIQNLLTSIGYFASWSFSLASNHQMNIAELEV